MALSKPSRRGGDGDELNITSMMDMMTIILVFLLKSYQTDDISVTPSDDLMIPVSTSLKPPKLAVTKSLASPRATARGSLPPLSKSCWTNSCTKVALNHELATRTFWKVPFGEVQGPTAKFQACQSGLNRARHSWWCSGLPDRSKAARPR